MNKRQKEIIEACGYRVESKLAIYNNSNKKLYLENGKNRNTYYDVDNKRICCYNNGYIDIVLNNESIYHNYKSNDEDINIESHYEIVSNTGDINSKIIIDIKNFSRYELVSKITLGAEKKEYGKNTRYTEYENVTICNYPEKAVVCTKCGNTVYKDKLYCTEVLFEIIMDYLNSIDVYYSNDSMKDLFNIISKFIVKDIDASFSMLDDEIDYQNEKYNKEIEKLTLAYNTQKGIVEEKIKVLQDKRKNR